MIPMLRGSQYIHVPEDAFLPWLAHGWSLPMVVESAGHRDMPWKKKQRNSLAVKIIRQIVAEYFNVTEAQIVGRCTRKEKILPRHVSIYLCGKLTPHSSTVLGMHFDDRDHSTILFAQNKIRDRMAADPEFAETVATLRERCEAALMS